MQKQTHTLTKDDLVPGTILRGLFSHFNVIEIPSMHPRLFSSDDDTATVIAYFDNKLEAYNKMCTFVPEPILENLGWRYNITNLNNAMSYDINVILYNNIQNYLFICKFTTTMFEKHIDSK